ncbi:MAG: FGGY-family carbohydrate kinase [Gemmataceae bacterium]
MPAAPLFLGLDVGTQSVRAAVYGLDGTCHGYATAPLETFHPHPAWAEQDAAQWWQATRTAVPAAMARAQAKPDDVVAVGLDATACTVIPCALDGTPLRRALLWMDQRSFREAVQVSATNDPALRYVSGVVSPEWMLPKALWLKRHEPELYHRADRIVECTDWFMHRLTGRWTLSLNNVTVKWDHVRPLGGWSDAFLSAAGLDDLRAKWPAEIVPLGKGDGRLTREAADELGLRAGTPVAQGGIDAYLGMLGMGAVGPGDLAMILGSSTCHLAMTEKPVLGSGLLGCYPDAVVEGVYTVEGGQTSTGSILDWYRRHLAGNEAQQAEKDGRNVWDLLDGQAAAVPAGCDGLVCLDYWQGNRCPLKDPRARGAWWGLTLSHGPGHLVRSIYEATACGTRHILEDAARFGLRVDRVFAGGGGARSRLWLQVHADVLGLPIHVPRDPEACARGALVAAVHAGHFPDLGAAAAAMVRMAGVVEPTAASRDAHDALYARYRATYPALRELFHATAE